MPKKNKLFGNCLIWAIEKSFWIAILLGFFLVIFIKPEGCSLGNIVYSVGGCPNIYASYAIGFVLAYVATLIVLTVYRVIREYKK